MSLAATAGISDRFTASAGVPFVQPVLETQPSMLQSIASAVIDRDLSGPSQQPDETAKIQEELNAALTNTSGVWNPANKGDGVGSKDAQMNGASKEQAAQDMRSGLENRVAGLQEKLARAAGPEAAPQGAAEGGKGLSGPGRFAAGVATGAIMTAINPGLGMAYAAAEGAIAVASFTGKGTLVTFNQSSSSLNDSGGGTKAERRAAQQEGAYERSAAAPAAPSIAPPMPAMPVDGPGFGPKPRDMFGRAEIARSSLTDPDFKGIQLDDTIAAKAIKSMENDARGIRTKLGAQNEMGLDAKDIDMAREVNVAPALQSFKM